MDASTLYPRSQEDGKRCSNDAASLPGREVVTDDIGYAAYTMDSHNCDRLVVNGMVKNEGNVEVGGFPPFPISYRSVVPKKEEVKNLFVPVCLSASHIAFGSIRMEPVFMVLAQSAAVAACLAIDKNITVQDVQVREIKNILQKNPKADFRKPEIVAQVSDTARITVKGSWKEVLMKGYGKYHLEHDSKTAGDYVQFSFDEKAAPGKYKVYYYFPKSTSSADGASLELFDGRRTTRQSLNLKNVSIIGQTTSTWVEVGVFNVDFKKHPYIKVWSDEAGSSVAANAILLVPDNE